MEKVVGKTERPDVEMATDLEGLLNTASVHMAGDEAGIRFVMVRIISMRFATICMPSCTTLGSRRDSMCRLHLFSKRLSAGMIGSHFASSTI